MLLVFDSVKTVVGLLLSIIMLVLYVRLKVMYSVKTVDYVACTPINSIRKFQIPVERRQEDRTLSIQKNFTLRYRRTREVRSYVKVDVVHSTALPSR